MMSGGIESDYLSNDGCPVFPHSIVKDGLGKDEKGGCSTCEWWTRRIPSQRVIIKKKVDFECMVSKASGFWFQLQDR